MEGARMFTGIVESEGIVTRAERRSGGVQLEVYAPDFGRDMSLGDSIALDGACLTIAKFIRGAFLADVSEETLARTTLGRLTQGSKVNLERAARLSDRLGGHIVTGHVDAVGQLAMRQPAGNSTVYTFAAPPQIMALLLEKASIAVDGISLTVAAMKEDGFTVAVVPHTETSTTLGGKPVGAQVNLETDLLAKYVRRFVGAYTGRGPEAPAKRGLGDMLREFSEGR